MVGFVSNRTLKRILKEILAKAHPIAARFRKYPTNESLILYFPIPGKEARSPIGGWMRAYFFACLPCFTGY
jgi:hypothetical protein